MFRYIHTILLSLTFTLHGYVIGETYGQMGNNLFQVATASALAWDHGTTAYFPRLTHNPKLYQHLFSRFSLYPPTDEISVEWEELQYAYHPIFYQPKMKLKGYFQSPKYFAHHRDKLLELFAPIPKDWQYIQKKYAWLIDHPHTVGIQIRYYSDSAGSIQYGRDFLEKAMALFPKESLFIVSTNNLDFARANLKGKEVVFLEKEPYYIEFYLLTLCKENIITNSTFGWWAAWLNQNPNPKVVCPLIWFEGVDTADLCPDSWIRIDAKKGRIDDPESY